MPDTATYYNTTDLESDALSEAVEKAQTQEQQALALFRARPDEAYTPAEVHNIAFTPKTPLTSVRRAITNLTDAGYLVKTGEQREGRYGEPNHCWTLRTGDAPLFE